MEDDPQETSASSSRHPPLSWPARHALRAGHDVPATHCAARSVSRQWARKRSWFPGPTHPQLSWQALCLPPISQQARTRTCCYGRATSSPIERVARWVVGTSPTMTVGGGPRRSSTSLVGQKPTCVICRTMGGRDKPGHDRRGCGGLSGRLLLLCPYRRCARGHLASEQVAAPCCPSPRLGRGDGARPTLVLSQNPKASLAARPPVGPTENGDATSRQLTPCPKTAAQSRLCLRAALRQERDHSRPAPPAAHAAAPAPAAPPSTAAPSDHCDTR